MAWLRPPFVPVLLYILVYDFVYGVISLCDVGGELFHFLKGLVGKIVLPFFTRGVKYNMWEGWVSLEPEETSR